MLLQQLQISQLTLLGPGLGDEVAAMLRQPVTVGMAGGHLGLHLPIAEQAALLQIHCQHLARAEATLFDDAALLKLDHTGF